MVLGGSSERKAPLAAAVVSPNVMSSCQFDDFERMTHVTSTSPSSGITSFSQFSPTKSDASSASIMDRAKVHSLSSTELRRDSFPPYVCSALRRSTAVVAPSLARTQPTQPATYMTQSAASSLLRFSPLPSSTYQQRPLSALSMVPPRSTQTLSKAMSDLSHSVSVCRSPVARSLLAPSSAASGEISYSLALSSALSSGSHSSTGQINTSNISTGQPLSRATQLSQLHPVSPSVSNPERRKALVREMVDVYMDRRNTREMSTLYNNPYPQRGTSAATTIGHTTFASSQPLTHAANLTRYHPYHGLNQTSQPATAQFPAGPFQSSSASTVLSQLQRLHTHSNSGKFTVGGV